VPGESPLPNVERANRALTGLWRRRILPEPVIEVEALEAAALRGRPRALLGHDEPWREPFEILVRSLHEEASLNPLGRAMAHGQLVMALRGRIRAQRLWARHPEILDRSISAPVIVLGQMRSGTTRMQRLLACDPHLAHTRMYESLFPIPRPGRRLLAAAGVALLNRLNPALGRIHPTSAHAAEEEFGLFSLSFAGALFEAQWRVPSFARWWERADKAPLYRELVALLRTVGWSRGKPPDKPQILKVPQFMQDLPAVLDAFTGARLIRLHRDAAAVVASSASLVWNQMRVQSDAADKAWIGREWLRKTRLRERVAAETLAAHPDVPRLDIDYDAMNRDWRGEIDRVYGFLGLELTRDVQRKMAGFLAGARRHLGHRYSLAEFGLEPADVASVGVGP
jgi:hypothetical protein